jgi:hypothetical protein
LLYQWADSAFLLRWLQSCCNPHSYPHQDSQTVRTAYRHPYCATAYSYSHPHANCHPYPNQGSNPYRHRYTTAIADVNTDAHADAHFRVKANSFAS